MKLRGKKMGIYKKYFLIVNLIVFCHYKTTFPSLPLSSQKMLIQKEKQLLESFLQQNKRLKELLEAEKGSWASLFKNLIEDYIKNNKINEKYLSSLIFRNPDIFTHFYSNDFINLPEDEKLRNSFLKLRFTILENSRQDSVFDHAIKQVNEPLYVDILKIFLSDYLDGLINGKESQVKKLKNNIIQLGRKLLVFEKNKFHEYIISEQKILEIPPFSEIFGDIKTNATNRLQSQIPWPEKNIDEVINAIKTEIAKETILDRAKIVSAQVRLYLHSIAARISDYYYKNRKK